jgi:hypothetical protein
VVLVAAELLVAHGFPTSTINCDRVAKKTMNSSRFRVCRVSQVGGDLWCQLQLDQVSQSELLPQPQVVFSFSLRHKHCIPLHLCVSLVYHPTEVPSLQQYAGCV